MSDERLSWRPADERAWAIWDELSARTPPCATSSTAWSRAWSARYGDAVPHRVAVVHRGETPIGAALVADGRRQRGRIPLRTAHLGTAGEPVGAGVEAPYQRLLAAPDDRDAVAAALMRGVHEQQRWDELRIERFDAGDAAALLAADPSLEAYGEPSPSVGLDEVDDGDALPALPSRTRQQVRRALRGDGPAVIELADDVAAAHAILDELIALHERRFAGGAFADPRFAAFHRDLVDALVPSGLLLLLRARSPRRTLGCVAVLRDGQRALSYTGGMAASLDRHDKPGFVTHALAMGVCAELGIAEYDLLTGPAPYKRELARLDRRQLTLSVRRRRPRVLLGGAVRRAGRHVPAASGTAVS